LLQYAEIIKSCENKHLGHIISADNRQNVAQDPAKSLSRRQMRRSPSWPQKKISAFDPFKATTHADSKRFSTTISSEMWPRCTHNGPKPPPTERGFRQLSTSRPDRSLSDAVGCSTRVRVRFAVGVGQQFVGRGVVGHAFGLRVPFEERPRAVTRDVRNLRASRGLGCGYGRVLIVRPCDPPVQPDG